MKLRTVLAGAIGASLLVFLLLRAGLPAVLGATARIGWGGLALLGALQLAQATMEGFAWALLGRGRPDSRVDRYLWARLVRDAAAQALPLGQVGGVALGGRALALEGVEGSFAAASTLTDMAVQFVTQLAYAALGAVMLQAFRPHNLLAGPVLVVIVGLVLMAAGLVYAQGHGAPWVERWLRRLGGREQRDGDAFTAMRKRPGTLAVATALHFAGWALTGVQVWLMLHMLRVGVSLGGALVIDSLTSGAKALAFLVPGALGVQEGAFAALGALFGVPLPAALALSLIRRGRDLGLALPVLAVWQARYGARIWVWRESLSPSDGSSEAIRKAPGL